jgi:hypothetical protein
MRGGDARRLVPTRIPALIRSPASARRAPFRQDVGGTTVDTGTLFDAAPMPASPK